MWDIQTWYEQIICEGIIQGCNVKKELVFDKHVPCSSILITSLDKQTISA